MQTEEQKKLIEQYCNGEITGEEFTDAIDRSIKASNDGNTMLCDVLFDNLVKNLRKNGYEVIVTLEDKYRFARVKGKYITGGFCEPNNGESYSYIDGKICFDNVKCFDKWSKCPYSFPIPKTEKQFEYVLSKMQYLASSEGYKRSNEYDLECEDGYPKNIA